MKRVTAVITMAGRGLRFRQAGYDCPKFEITVRGRSLFSWSMESLRSFIDTGARFVFVARRADAAIPFISAEAERLGIRGSTVIELDAMSDGQATTALLAAPALADEGDPLLVYNIDTYVDPAFLPAAAVKGDGWIPCFPGRGSAWSFARADANGRVLEVREKVRISPHATVGLYWFSSFRVYREAYEHLYGANTVPEAGERYIAPMYNELIANDRAVYLHLVPRRAVVPLGTPADVATFAGATGGG